MVTTTIRRSSERTILSNMESTVKNCKQWLRAKSETFSALCGEEFTHQEVIIAHAACVLLIVVCCMAELIEKGGAL